MRIPTGVFAAGEPVEEDWEAPMVITDVVANDVRAHLAEVETQVKYAIAGGVGSLAVAVALALVGPILAAVAVGALGLLGSGGYAWYVLQTEPDVSVVAAEKRYWTGYVVPQTDGALVYDATGSVATTNLQIEQLEDLSLLHDSAQTFAEDIDLPVVETAENNVEATVEQTLQNTRSQIEAAETVDIEAPLPDRPHDVMQGIASLPMENAAPDVQTDTVAVDLEQASRQAEQIAELETMAFDDDAEERLDEMKAETESVVETLTTTKESMVKRLNDHVDIAGEITSMMSYNFYCPDCVADDIYSRLELEFADGPEWFCDTCRNSFTADDDPVPKYRIKDELVEDIWDQLWIEKDDEKRRIYENIEDQKNDLKEQEFQQRQEAIRTAWGRIKDLRSKIRDLETEAKAERGAVQEIGDVMQKYDRLSEQRRQSFESDVEEALREIESDVEEAIDEMRNYEEEKIKESQEEAEERAELIRAEERKRHQEKMAKLESIDQTQEELLEHEKEAHEREMLMEARGGTSMFDTLNRYRMGKGKRFGFSKGDD